MLSAAIVRLAESSEIVNGTYPGGASASDPVPEQTAYYLTPVGYGIAFFIFLVVCLFLVTRLNIDR